MIQIDRIEQVIMGQGERLLSRVAYPSWEEAFAALRGHLPTLTADHEAEIRANGDTQIGPVMELVLGVGAAYSARVLYDVRVLP